MSTCSKLFFFKSPENIELFDLVFKILEVIILAMSGFPSCLQVQANAATVLSNMSMHSDNIVVLNTEQDRLEFVLTQTMTQFPECREKCKSVLKVLIYGMTRSKT